MFGIFGHPEAAKLSYLGLYALQHRGQESAGIASTDGAQVLQCTSRWGWCRKLFTPEVIAQLPGDASIGHTRYSTAGDNTLMNAQPVVIDCNKGKIALAHNGNLTNAIELRQKLEHRGSIFQTTSDTEVIVHLIARSSGAESFRGDCGCAESGGRRIFAAVADARRNLCDSRSAGIQAAVFGKAGWGVGGGFGNLRVGFDRCGICARSGAGRNGADFAQRRWNRIHFAPEKPLQQCIFEHVYFSRPDSLVFGSR